MEFVIGILGAGIGSGIMAIVLAALQRKWAKADKQSNEYTALKKALMYVILDRIRYLGQVYIEDGEIDFDDRRLLNEMHGVYHNDLAGNGDLDTLMKEVNSLPLKTREH